MLSQLMDIILIVNNADDFSDNFFTLIAMFISCCKSFFFVDKSQKHYYADRHIDEKTM